MNPVFNYDNSEIYEGKVLFDLRENENKLNRKVSDYLSDKVKKEQNELKEEFEKFKKAVDKR